LTIDEYDNEYDHTYDNACRLLPVTNQVSGQVRGETRLKLPPGTGATFGCTAFSNPFGTVAI